MPDFGRKGEGHGPSAKTDRARCSFEVVNNLGIYRERMFRRRSQPQAKIQGMSSNVMILCFFLLTYNKNRDKSETFIRPRKMMILLLHGKNRIKCPTENTKSHVELLCQVSTPKSFVEHSDLTQHDHDIIQCTVLTTFLRTQAWQSRVL